MSDATVRAALVAYLNQAAIPGIPKWYLDEPWIIQGNQWDFQPGGFGAVAYVHIDDVKESRITLPSQTPLIAAAGNKRVDYTVSFLILYKFQVPTNATPGSEDQWVGPLDTMIGQFKAAVRADPNAGAPAVIWQWGQAENGISHTRDLPVRNGGYVQSWNRVEVAVTEIITA